MLLFGNMSKVLIFTSPTKFFSDFLKMILKMPEIAGKVLGEPPERPDWILEK